MVIPTVIQMGASSTADITNNCPEWGIYAEGLRGSKIPLTRFCKTHGVLRIWQISLHKFWKQSTSRELPMTDKEKETKEGIAYRTKRTIDRTKEEFYHPLVE